MVNKGALLDQRDKLNFEYWDLMEKKKTQYQKLRIEQRKFTSLSIKSKKIEREILETIRQYKEG